MPEMKAMTTSPPNDSSFAVITGASQGLGRAFAEELARRNINLILLSLPGQQLHETSDRLAGTYRIRTAWYETDLSDTSNVMKVAGWINENFNIFLLINNAGTGGTKSFMDADATYINRILQLNVVATSLLTRELLPNLLRQPHGYILNVSSMAAFTPSGFKTVYPASKSFIHSFSRGLYSELRHTPVFVSVVNPGAMKTNEEITARIEKQGLLGRLTLKDPAAVAKRAISQLFKRDTVIIINPFSWLMMQLIPVWIRLPLMTKAIQREIRR